MASGNVKSMRWLGGILLLVLGFAIGTAWKSYDHQPSEEDQQDATESMMVSNKDTGPAMIESNGLNPNELATINLFEKAAPTVCFITTTKVRLNYFTRDVTEIPSGTGSGFVWDKAGHIVTNYHVIQGADQAQVTMADQSSWKAELVGVAPEKDLAVLKITAPAERLTPIPVGTSDNLLVGQSVFAIGNPFGLDQTLTTGIVSALGREIQSVSGIPIRDVIQTDAAINPGNSGGPLLDSSGKLIGVNTAIYSPSGASAGIGFSIPVDVVTWVIPELIQFGKIQRPTLGVELARPQITRQWGLQGALVIDVIKGSGSDNAGIRPTYRNRDGRIVLGDIIVGINNEKIQSNNDLVLSLENYKPGDRVIVSLLREEKVVEVEVVLDKTE